LIFTPFIIGKRCRKSGADVGSLKFCLTFNHTAFSVSFQEKHTIFHDFFRKNARSFRVDFRERKIALEKKKDKSLRKRIYPLHCLAADSCGR